VPDRPDVVTAIARSPVPPAVPVLDHGWEVTAQRSTAALTLADLSPLSKVLVRAPVEGAVREALGTPFGRATRRDLGSGPVLVIGAGPGEWLVLDRPGRGADLVTTLRGTVEATGEFASVVDLTHGRALVRLTGRQAPDALAAVCGIGLADHVTPDGTALRTSVAAVVTDVVRDDGDERGGGPSYLLHCERSSGQYLFGALLEAGRPFGIEVDGPVLDRV
jgi:sarcosine oxidase subunit gamma